MKLKVLTPTGTKASTVTLPETIFSVPLNPVVMAQYLHVYSTRQRQGTKRAKSRGEVVGTTAKVWRQKGTGRARHGSRKAPIFVGGGQAHGPTGMENYQLRLSKTLRRQALFQALSTQASNLSVVSGLESAVDSTKSLENVIKKLLPQAPSILLVLPTSDTPLIRFSANLPQISVTQASRLNAFEVINAKHLVFTPESLDKLQSVYLNSTTLL